MAIVLEQPARPLTGSDRLFPPVVPSLESALTGFKRYMRAYPTGSFTVPNKNTPPFLRNLLSEVYGPLKQHEIAVAISEASILFTDPSVPVIFHPSKTIKQTALATEGLSFQVIGGEVLSDGMWVRGLSQKEERERQIQAEVILSKIRSGTVTQEDRQLLSAPYYVTSHATHQQLQELEHFLESNRRLLTTHKSPSSSLPRTAELFFDSNQVREIFSNEDAAQLEQELHDVLAKMLTGDEITLRDNLVLQASFALKEEYPEDTLALQRYLQMRAEEATEQAKRALYAECYETAKNDVMIFSDRKNSQSVA